MISLNKRITRYNQFSKKGKLIIVLNAISQTSEIIHEFVPLKIYVCVCVCVCVCVWSKLNNQVMHSIKLAKQCPIHECKLEPRHLLHRINSQRLTYWILIEY